jgi:hypothetical protein
MLKSTPVTVEQPKEEVKQEQPKQIASVVDSYMLGVPPDVYLHFGVGIENTDSKQRTRIKELYDWANNESVNNFGDVMLKIRNLENSLGKPSIGESRVDRIWRWVSLQRRINDLHKQQDSIKGV